MTNSIGQNIKRLRGEKGFTQEELAELINVTPQAVSKWENESGLPDISQIVPLASAFGVSTDTIFGTDGIDENAEALKITEEAMALQKYGDAAGCLAAYDRLTEGLKKYPCSMTLLNNCMRLGLTLSLQKNGRLYAAARADKIAAETKHQAKLIIAHSKAVSDIMGAREVLILLYTAGKDYDKAIAEAAEFPVRTDQTLYSYLAGVYTGMGDRDRAATCLCSDIYYAVQGLENDAARLGKVYFDGGRYEEAIEVYEAALSILDGAFGKYPRPPYHDFESGDLYILLAEAYLKIGDNESAMRSVERAVGYYLELAAVCDGEEIAPGHFTKSPLIRKTEVMNGIKKSVIKSKLLEKLKREEIQPLALEGRFKELCRRVRKILNSVGFTENLSEHDARREDFIH